MDDDDDDDDLDDGTTTTANAAVKTLTFNEWLAMGPPEAQAVFRRAVAVEKREREAIVSQLTANVAADDKARLSARLLSKPLDELQDLLSLAPRRREAVGAANYFGMAVPETPVVNHDEDDYLPLPVMNWDDK